MSASNCQHQRLLKNGYYAGILDNLNFLNGTLEENVQAFSCILPYYDAALSALPMFSDDGWEDMWHYLGERSYGLQYKRLILNAHYAGTLVRMNPCDVVRGDWEALASASNLPPAPSFLEK